MFRRRVASLALAILSSLALAVHASCQQPGHSQASSRRVPFVAALEVAAQVASRAAEGAPLPDRFSVQTADGQSISVSAGQAVGLLAAAADAAARAETPTLSLLDDRVGTPIATAGSLSGDASFLVATHLLTAECRPLLRFTASLGGLPSAVWVGGRRLSAAEFTVALAAALQHASETGRLPESVRVVAARPPAAWRLAESTLRTPQLPALPGPTPDVPRPATVAPRIELVPGNGARLSGQVDVVAALIPAVPDVTVTFYLDGRVKGSSNWPPFSMRVDVDGLKPGTHEISVRAEGSSGELIAEKRITFVAASPATK